MGSLKYNIGKKAFSSLDRVEQSLKNRSLFVGLIITTAFVFATSLVINYFSGNPSASFGLFKHSIANISRTYPLNITPAGYAFSIWGLIYLLQLAWIIFSLGLICRQTDEGPAYLNPVVLSPLYFIFFNLATVFNIGWLFLWDRFLFVASFIFLVCIALSLFMSLSIGSARLHFFKAQLIDSNRKLDVRVLQVAMVNGLAMYATWTTIASLINLGVTLVYKLSTPLTNENASVACVCILAILVSAYVVLDLSILEQYTRFTFSPYITVVWALIAVLVENWNSDNVSSIVTVTLLGAIALASLIKLVTSIRREQLEMYQYRQMKFAQPQAEELENC